MSRYTRFLYSQFGMLLVFSLGAGLLLRIAYLREVFHEPLRLALGLTNKELGDLSSLYGICAFVCYIPGGILADAFRIKYLLVFSALCMGVISLWYASLPSYFALQCIYGLMGILAGLTYWSAFLKAIRSLGTDREQGKLYGISEAIRAVLGVATSFMGLYYIESAATNQEGIQDTLIFYGIVYLFVGIFYYWYFPDTLGEEEETESRFTRSMILATFKNPGVWLVAVIVFSLYTIYILQSYTTMYMKNVWLIPAAVAAATGIIRQYGTGFIAGPLSGFIGDRTQSPSKVVCLCFLCIAVLLGLMLIPVKNTTLELIVLILLLGFFVAALRGLQYAIMPEAGISLATTGTATGIISTIGYLPDMYVYSQVGHWIDVYPAETAYRMIFVYMLLMCFLAVLCCLGIFFLARKRARMPV